MAKPSSAPPPDTDQTIDYLKALAAMRRAEEPNSGIRRRVSLHYEGRAELAFWRATITAHQLAAATNSAKARLAFEEATIVEENPTAFEERLKKRVNPPAAAQFLLTLLVKGRTREAVLGDLHERFTTNVAKLGEGRASLLYFAEALRSLSPLLWSLLRRAGISALVLDLFRRLIG